MTLTRTIPKLNPTMQLLSRPDEGPRRLISKQQKLSLTLSFVMCSGGGLKRLIDASLQCVFDRTLLADTQIILTIIAFQS